MEYDKALRKDEILKRACTELDSGFRMTDKRKRIVPLTLSLSHAGEREFICKGEGD
ncbi:MAG TPA: hypothetical protein VFJ67_08445 [Thermodesulfobacteriota bacterium]|nr:hypothetical protein [Thermodesulfobacteriota bacterium]